MDRTWAIRSGIGAAFLGGVLLLLPPTETKATWTSVNHAVPTRVYDPPVAIEPEPVVAAAYEPARDEASSSEQIAYARPDRWDDAVQDEATAREIEIAEADRAYGDGYAWASENDVRDARECRRLQGPRVGGCRDYVASFGSSEDDRDL